MIGLVITYNSTRFMGKIGVIYFCIAFILPISINYMMNSIKEGFNTTYNNKNREVGIKNIKTGHNKYNKKNYMSNCNSQIQEVNYKPKIIDNEFYDILRGIIIEGSQKQTFNRIEILDFKIEIDKILGSHIRNYEGFKFKNDFHEIYTKLKSSKFKDEDYIYLTEYLLEIIKKKGINEIK